MFEEDVGDGDVVRFVEHADGCAHKLFHCGEEGEVCEWFHGGVVAWVLVGV